MPPSFNNVPPNTPKNGSYVWSGDKTGSVFFASTGTISKINPLVEIKKNQKLKFDLSDSSLSFIQNSITYSAFSLDLFSDNEFNNLFTIII